jgi:drug/metabolite transporter (DMT)-like permease
MTGRTTGKIAGETQKDSISIRRIALVTLFFLPATFLSALFSMPFFDYGVFNEMSLVWVYFVAAVLLTSAVMILWYFWLQSRMKLIRKGEEEDFLLYRRKQAKSKAFKQ